MGRLKKHPPPPNLNDPRAPLFGQETGWLCKRHGESYREGKFHFSPAKRQFAKMGLQKVRESLRLTLNFSILSGEGRGRR